MTPRARALRSPRGMCCRALGVAPLRRRDRHAPAVGREAFASNLRQLLVQRRWRERLVRKGKRKSAVYREKTRAPKTQAEKQRELAEAKEQAKAKVAAACKATAGKSVVSCGHALKSQAFRARRSAARARAQSRPPCQAQLGDSSMHLHQDHERVHKCHTLARVPARRRVVAA